MVVLVLFLFSIHQGTPNRPCLLILFNFFLLVMGVCFALYSGLMAYLVFNLCFMSSLFPANF